MVQAAGQRVGPHLKPATGDSGAVEALTAKVVRGPARASTLGSVGPAVRVSGADRFAPVYVHLPIDDKSLTGIDARTLRMFSWDQRRQTYVPYWNSGANVTHGYVWAKIERAGEYLAIGLPKDQLLAQSLRAMVVARRFADPSSAPEMEDVTRRGFQPLVEASVAEIEQVRNRLAAAEIQFSQVARSAQPLRVRNAGYLAAFPLPGGMSIEQLRERIGDLKVGAEGLPEEALFFPPESGFDFEPPWGPGLGPLLPEPLPWWPWPRPWPWPWPRPWPPRPWCWFFSPNWPMYHHDPRHSGVASGCSRLTTTTVGGLQPQMPIPLPGASWSVPTVVDGQAYVGLIDGPMGGGRLCRVDLATGAIDPNTFDTPSRVGAYAQGIGGSPAVVGDYVYISNIPGTVHCLHKSDLGHVWTTSLTTANSVTNQPVNNPNADCWTSPVVIGNNLYVGCGEGEGGAWGFVYCLAADTGHVNWLFCTDQFQAGVSNQRNQIPQSAAAPWAAAAGFTLLPDPPTGGSVWSSCAYFSGGGVSRIYVGTGNSNVPATGNQVDGMYGSGVLALDAISGDFVAFYSPTTDQSYRTNDQDIDVCGSPVIFSHGGQTLVAIGSKSGAFFVFDIDLNLIQFRQLLPYYHDDPTNPAHLVPIPGFDHDGGAGENMFGVFGTPAVSYSLQSLFVGLGGYMGIGDQRVPFMRAVHWDTLSDRWPTTLVGGVDEYIVPNPPMYQSDEAGLSSPTLVNDLVFIATSKPALYALEAATGHCKWAAPNMVLSGTEPDAWWKGCLGAVVYGDTVVAAAGDKLYIYAL